MECLKFSEVTKADVLLESPTEFAIQCQGRDVLLWGHSSDFYILEMLYSCNYMNNFPFCIRTVSVPQDRPLADMLQRIDFVNIYNRANALEVQELVLDPRYMVDCTQELPSANLVQAELFHFNEQENACCILTSYGACQLLKCEPISSEWKPLNCKVNAFLASSVFPFKDPLGSVKSFTKIREYIDTYFISAFSWGPDHHLYLGTAAGYIVLLQYQSNANDFEFVAKLKTSLKDISYIKTTNNVVILFGNNVGQIGLIKYTYKCQSLKELHSLWGRRDNMACCKALMTFNESSRCYTVVFCKAAHILAYSLDCEGNILSDARQYVNGIKISDIVHVAENELIVITIMGIIHRVNIHIHSPGQLNIDVQRAEHDLDYDNYQMYGGAKLQSGVLWLFLQVRNKDYTTQSKYESSSVLITVCKNNSQDSLTKLLSSELRCRDETSDAVLSIFMDINRYVDFERYNEFMDIEHLQCPNGLQKDFLPKLQTKYLIVWKSAEYQQMRYKTNRRQTEQEKYFLECLTSLIHILERLKHLQTLYALNVKLSLFQERSISCMQREFERYFNNMGNCDGEENILSAVVERFKPFLSNEFETYKFNTQDFVLQEEKCWICGENIIIGNPDGCQNGHVVKRCVISSLQIPLLQSRYCTLCKSLVTDETGIDLRELFAPHELVTCTFCRFLLKDSNSL